MLYFSLSLMILSRLRSETYCISSLRSPTACLNVLTSNSSSSTCRSTSGFSNSLKTCSLRYVASFFSLLSFSWMWLEMFLMAKRSMVLLMSWSRMLPSSDVFPK